MTQPIQPLRRSAGRTVLCAVWLVVIWWTMPDLARAPIGSGLTVDAGKFVTPAGAEVIETQDNWNYSRSLLFAWAIPYYHAGVRASYAVNDKVTATGFVLNGWNNVKDNNASKSVAAQVVVAPTDRVSLAATWMGGAEQTAVDGWRHMVDAIVNVTLTPRVKLQLNADLVRDRGLGPGVGWHGVAALRAQLTPAWRRTWWRARSRCNARSPPASRPARSIASIDRRWRSFRTRTGRRGDGSRLSAWACFTAGRRDKHGADVNVANTRKATFL